MPSILCPKCGQKTLYNKERPQFCSYCGGALRAEDAPPDALEQALASARMEDDTAKKYALLLQARERFSGAFEVEREILFLGRLYERGGRPDFYRIPYWPLAALETPGEFSEKERGKMIERFFQNPEIARVAALSPDADAFLDEYLLHMAREYVNMFLKGNSQNSTLLGFKRKPADVFRRCAACMRGMLRNARTCELIQEDTRARLVRALEDAFVLEFAEFPAREYLSLPTNRR